MNPVWVRQTEDRFYWHVAFVCCDARPLLMHDWTRAMQVADKHARGHATATSETAPDPAFFPFDALDPYIALTAGTDQMEADR